MKYLLNNKNSLERCKKLKTNNCTVTKKDTILEQSRLSLEAIK